MTNPVLYFEIPVLDMTRAIAFYQNVFQVNLIRNDIDGYQMALFPRSDDKPGASGALAQGDVYKPSRDGSIVYFDVDEIDSVLERACTSGGSVLYAKTNLGEPGYIAELEDSEGNRIGLTQAAY